MKNLTTFNLLVNLHGSLMVVEEKSRILIIVIDQKHTWNFHMDELIGGPK